MEFTAWEAKQYLQVHKQLPAQNVDEMRTLLDIQDKLSEAEGPVEIEDHIMKKGYEILNKYGPKWEQDRKILELLEKLESL